MVRRERGLWHAPDPSAAVADVALCTGRWARNVRASVRDVTCRRCLHRIGEIAAINYNRGA